MTDTFDNRLTRVPIYTSSPEDVPGPEPVVIPPQLMTTETPPQEPWYSRAGNALLGVLDQFGVAGLPEGERREATREARNKLLHIGPMEEQDYLWPEKMLRSAITLAGDVRTGNVPPPGLRREDYTDIPADPSKVGGTPHDDLIQRVQDMAGLAMTGGLAGTGAGGKVLGSGPVRRGLVAEENANGTRRIPMSQYNQDMETAGILFDQAAKWRKSGQKPTVEKLDPAELLSTQNTFEEGVGHAGGFRGMNDKPLVARTPDGQLHILDGHHRLEAAAEKGKKLPSYVIDVKGDPALYAKNEAAAPLAALEKRGPVWYSPVEHALEQSTQARATGAQWLATIRNSRGVKPEELDWTGLRQFLEERADQPVSRPELHEYLRDNRVELKDVTKGEGKPLGWDELSRSQKIEVRELWEDALGDGSGSARRVSDNEIKKWFDGLDAIERLDQGFDWSVPTKYHDYQLPGGENYREHLITMPKQVRPIPPEIRAAADAALRKGFDNRFNIQHWGSGFDPVKVGRNWLETGKITPEDFAAIEAYHDALPASDKYMGTFSSSHWDEPNIVAHVRSNVREMPSSDGQGPVRSLHLEEVQSDWHQAGRRKGYKPQIEQELARLVERRGTLQEEASKLSFSDPRYKEIYQELPKIQSRINEIGSPSGSVPDAPWKKTWHELALRRMIRLAAEEGMDRISWTPGEAQAARYDLSKHVDELAYNPAKQHLQGWREGNGVIDQKVSPDKLPDVVGKDVAERLNSGSVGEYKRVSGQDLKVGGEGMRGFYDKMMVQAAEKLGREYGVKVRKGRVPGNTNVRGGEALNVPPREIYDMMPELQQRYPRVADFVDYYNNLNSEMRADLVAEARMKGGQEVWYFDVPLAMREAALGRGMPLFSGGKMFVPSGAQRSEESE